MQEHLLPSKSKKCLRFLCPKESFAKNLWKHLLSYQVFYNEPTAQNVKPRVSGSRLPLIGRSATFRCPTNKLMKELKESATPERTPAEVPFSRCT